MVLKCEWNENIILIRMNLWNPQFWNGIGKEWMSKHVCEDALKDFMFEI